MRAARPLLIVLTFGWLGLLLAAPSMALGAPLSAATYVAGSAICHQQRDRSFHLAAAQLPVCARCFGLYAGAAAGLAAAVAAGIAGTAQPPLSRLRLLILVAALPTAATWILEVARLWQPGNVERCAAALPLGAAVALTVNYVGCARPLPTGPRAPRTRT